MSRRNPDETIHRQSVGTTDVKEGVNQVSESFKFVEVFLLFIREANSHRRSKTRIKFCHCRLIFASTFCVMLLLKMRLSLS